MRTALTADKTALRSVDHWGKGGGLGLFVCGQACTCKILGYKACVTPVMGHCPVLWLSIQGKLHNMHCKLVPFVVCGFEDFLQRVQVQLDYFILQTLYLIFRE